MEALEQTTVSWPEAVVAIVVMILIWSGTALVIVQLMITWRARMAVARDKQYRQLAEEAIRNQQKLEASLSELSEELKKHTTSNITAKTKK